jgi:hypothetical protein
VEVVEEAVGHVDQAEVEFGAQSRALVPLD